MQINDISIKMVVNFAGNITVMTGPKKKLGDTLTKINNSFKKYNTKLTKVIQKKLGCSKQPLNSHKKLETGHVFHAFLK